MTDHEMEKESTVINSHLHQALRMACRAAVQDDRDMIKADLEKLAKLHGSNTLPLEDVLAVIDGTLPQVSNDKNNKST